MSKYLVQQSGPLHGVVEISGSKNSVLPILAASILSTEECTLEDVPRLNDVDIMCSLLESLGVKVDRDKENNKAVLHADTINNHKTPDELVMKMRASMVVMGPLLARTGKAEIHLPGGCAIGDRPVELHFKGLRALGAKISVSEEGLVTGETDGLYGADIYLDFPSVGATENIMMSAVFLRGQTTIMNAAKEPEIVDLANFINKIGGKILGAGTSTITILGVDKLFGCNYRPIADRIIAGTYLIGVAMTKGRIRLEKANYQDVYALLNKLRNAGCDIDYDSENIYLECKGRPISCPSIETQPFPGFPTDLQAQILALQTISNGISVITENLFETRFKHVPELLKMGAKVTTKDRMAIVRGVVSLHGAEVFAYDLRGGAALVLAGLTTSDQTIVQNVKYIDRGYDKFEEKLSLLGADITRKC